MKIEKREFEVQVPKLDGSGVAEKVKVMVPVYWDEEIQDWLMTSEAHDIIDNTKERLTGLLLPDQLKELRERYSYSQREIGELFQVGEKSWNRWETGKQRPSRSINLLIRALYEGEISINYLLKRAGKPQREDVAESISRHFFEKWESAALKPFDPHSCENVIAYVKVSTGAGKPALLRHFGSRGVYAVSPAEHAIWLNARQGKTGQTELTRQHLRKKRINFDQLA